MKPLDLVGRMKMKTKVKLPSEAVLKRAWVAGTDAVRAYSGLPPEDTSHMWNPEKLNGMKAAAAVILGLKPSRKV